MNYILGTETEKMVVTGGAIRYEPAGLAHAVDPTRAPAEPATLGYAECGRAVRIWRSERFRPQGPSAHTDCAVHAGSTLAGEAADAVSGVLARS